MGESWMFEKLKQWKMPMGMLKTSKIVLVLALAALIGCWLYFFYLDWHLGSSRTMRLMQISEFSRNVGLSVAGIIALCFAGLRIRYMDRSDRRDREKFDDEKAKFEHEEKIRIEGKLDSAFARFVDGSSGVKEYSLIEIERIVQERPKEHLGNSISRLCSLANEKLPTEKPIGSGAESKVTPTLEPPIIKLIVALVARLVGAANDLKIPTPDWCLEGLPITGVTLRNVLIVEHNFAGCSFTKVDFESCTFKGIFAETFKCTDCFFRVCTFDDALFFQCGFANLQASYSLFNMSTFKDCIFKDASWHSCNFINSGFENTKIDCNGGEVGRIFGKCEMSNVRFKSGQGEIETGYRWNYLSTDFQENYVTKGDVFPSGLKLMNPRIEAKVSHDSDDGKLQYFSVEPVAESQ